MKGIIVVLGSPNDDKGRLYDVAIQRCEVAISLFRKKDSYKFLLTGGFGKHFNCTDTPHAYYLAMYLKKAGIPEKNILDYALSANSIEDALLAKEIIVQYAVKPIIIVTSDYHINRAKFIFKQVFKGSDYHLEYKAARTNIKKSGLDIKSLIKHEKRALKKLKSEGIDRYYA